MTLFTWLLLGHLLGDFVFQNDWMARNKQRALFTVPGFMHFTVYTICMLIALWAGEKSGTVSPPLTLRQYGVFAATIFITHWIIDAMDAAGGWGRLVHQGGAVFVRVVVDQTFHLLVVVVLIERMLN